MLPSPAHATELKVFQGGGGIPDGAQPQISLYDQPAKPVDMIVYRGGGTKGLDAKTVLDLKFREKTVKDLLDSEVSFLKAENLLVFEYRDAPDTPYEVNLEKLGKILVIPFSFKDNNFSYIIGKNKDFEYNLENIFFYADSFNKSEATSEDFKQTKTFVLPFTLLLKPTSKKDDTVKTGAVVVTETTKPKEEEAKGRFFNSKETKDIIQAAPVPVPVPVPESVTAPLSSTTPVAKDNKEIKLYTNVPLIKLDNGMRVRFVNADVKKDIEELRFTPAERRLFEDVLHFNNPFIENYLLQHKEKWVQFWQTFINNGKAQEGGLNGTSPFFYLSAKKGKEVRDFFREVREAYEFYLMDRARDILFKTDSYGYDKLYNFKKERSEKGLDYSFFEVPAPAKKGTAEGMKEKEGVENIWNSISKTYSMIQLKIDEFEDTYNSLKMKTDALNTEYKNQKEELKRAQSIQSSPALLSELNKKVSTLLYNVKNALVEEEKAYDIYLQAKQSLEKEQAFLQQKSIKTFYETISNLMKTEKGIENLTPEMKANIGDLGKNIELVKKDIELLSKKVAISSVQKSQEEEKMYTAEGKKGKSKGRPKKAKGEEMQEDDEEEDEYEGENDETNEEDQYPDFDEEIKEARKSQKIKPAQKEEKPKEEKPKQPKSKQQIKEQEVEQMLKSTFSHFLVEETDKYKVLGKDENDESRNTRILFYFLLLEKLKKYIYEEEKINVGNIPNIPKDKKIKFERFKKHIQDAIDSSKSTSKSTDKPIFFASWQAFKYLNLQTLELGADTALLEQKIKDNIA